MEVKSFFIYLAVMAGSTYLIRAVPFALIHQKIENRFIKSFLHYIPFAVLSAMTFPAILHATDSVISAAIGFGTAVLFAWKGKSLTSVAVAACIAVFLSESILLNIL